MKTVSVNIFEAVGITKWLIFHGFNFNVSWVNSRVQIILPSGAYEELKKSSGWFKGEE